MDNNTVDYHLTQAASHLEMALLQTKMDFDNESTVEENARKWSDFLTFLFGNMQNTPPEE